jgi:N-acetylglucosaminyl-diphospho-decaprenol L-rhamnosyltransferase
MTVVQDALEPLVRSALLPSLPSWAVAHGPPVVSVCIANWNCKDLLRSCLASLFDRPQGVSFEVIVVDNASTDGAAEMVAAAFPTVRLLRNPANLGFSRANNQAATVARGQYFFFLNNDTVVPRGTLGQLTTFAKTHPEVGMIGPRLLGADGVPQISYRRAPTMAALLHRIALLRWTGLFRKAYSDYRRDTYEPNGVKSVEGLMGAAVFLPRDVFERSGRWDERYGFGGEDLDLSAQVRRNNSVVYHGDVTVVHYGRVSSKANYGFVAGNVTVGYVQYLRKAGESRLRIALYKLLVTFDAPIQLVQQLIQLGTRWLRGRKADAVKSKEGTVGYWHFLTRDLFRFWRA